MPENCDNPISCVVDGVTDVANGIGSTVDFWSDPAGNSFKALKDAAHGLATDLLPALTDATLPDLTADWFLNAYAISFALAIFGWVLITMHSLLQLARHRISPNEAGSVLTSRAVLFLVCSMFGPSFGAFLIQITHALSSALAAWGLSTTADETTTKLQTMIDESDALAFAGGAVVACILMAGIVIGLLLVLIALLVQLVALYFTGIVAPLAFMWFAHPDRQAQAWKIAGLWLGLLLAHPLLFLLLGVGWSLMASSADVLGNNASLEKTVQFLVACISFTLVAGAPMALMKFAPVLPGTLGSTQPSPSSRGHWGADSMQDVQRTQSVEDSAPVTTATEAADNASDVPGPLGAESTAGAAAAGIGSPPSEPGAAKAGTASAGETAETAGGTAEAAGGTAEAAEAAAETAEVASAAGTAESATGVGALIGIPTLLAAGATEAAAQSIELADEAGQAALDVMDEPEVS